MRALRACQFLASSCFFGCLVLACGSTGSSDEGGNGKNGTAAAGPDLGPIGSGGSGNGETCAGELIEAKSIPLDMYVMLDSSGSMLDPTEGNALLTKWQSVSDALADF